MASFERFTEVLDIKPQIEDKPDAVALEVSEGSIDFEDVSFSYETDGREIVIDGQTVARVITPYVDSELGRSSRLKARGI